ncbi:MAG: HlyD family efflux transporter periplasmic adaptor subunit [Actinobacteria bacterium]|nr:MAG: HlyD family efflux transporter periplasmic adaptor subunit [Actinomycetota bacterium]
MKKAFRLIILVAVVAAVGGIAYYVLSQQEAQNGRLAASGTIEATEIEVSAQTAARITSVAVSEGDRVKKGQMLVRLDYALLADQVKQAKAGISAARAALKATRDDGTNADIAAAKAQLRQANVAYQMAAVQLSYAAIKSPQAGIVLSVPVSAGENATPGTIVAVVGDLRTVRVDVFVPEAQLGLVKIGQAAKVGVDSYPGEDFDGKVTRIASQAEFTPGNIETKEQRVKQVFRTTVTLVNLGQKLKPGMPADVAFE